MRLADAFRYLRRLTLRSPQRCDVVILDREGAASLARMSLAGVPHAVLETRHERFYLSPRVLLRLFANRRLFARVRREGYTSSLAGAFHHVYLLSCLEAQHPRIVLTWIDNYSRSWWLSRMLEGRSRFVGIQNGIRFFECAYLWPRLPEPLGRVYLQDFLCFGRHERELYESRGHCVERYHPVGSVRGGYYRFERQPVPPPPSHDLCLPSTWTPEDGWGTTWDSDEWRPHIEHAERKLSAFLARYLEERDVTLVVALRSGDPREKDHFRSCLGERVRFVERDDAVMSTYAAMDAARVVVSTNSTSAFEALGWGRKVMMGDYIETDWGRLPSDGIWADRSDDYESFRSHLDILLEMSDEEFARSTGESATYLMDYDDHPAHSYLRDLVLAELDEDGSRE